METDHIPTLNLKQTAKEKLRKTVRMLNYPQPYQFFLVFKEKQEEITRKHADIAKDMAECRSLAIEAATAIQVIANSEQHSPETSLAPYLKRIKQEG